MAVNSANVTLSGLTFEDNEYVMSDSGMKKLKDAVAAEQEPLLNGLITVFIPTGADAVAVRLENTLFTHNNAIGFSSSGNLKFHSEYFGVYNSSFYDV